MYKIIKLVNANIRKTKGHTISLLLMFFLSAMLLNIGLLIFSNFGSYLDGMAEELHTSDIYYAMPDSFYNKRMDEYLKSNDNIVELEIEEALWGTARVRFRTDEAKEHTILFRNMEKTRSLSQFKFIGKRLPAEGSSIYLPYLFQLEGGYQLNDTFQMSFQDTVLEFTVKGFIEDVLFSSPETGPMGVYISQSSFDRISKELGGEYQAKLIFTNQKEANKRVESDLQNFVDKDTISRSSDITHTVYSLDLPLVKLSRVMIPSMVSVMIVAFAASIVIVGLVVVRFRINNSIEEDMSKIGSMKAVGYTSRQIILSVVLQFSSIALIGSLVGIGASYLILPVLSDVFARQSGLWWDQGFDVVISGIAFLLILMIIGAVAYLSARKLKKLHPIIALRGGIVTHSFRKNQIALHRSKGSLPVVLAIKSMLQNKKQSIMMAFIMLSLSFAQTFAVIMFYNTTIDTRAFLETPGIELSNALAVFKPELDREKILHGIRAMEGVRKAQYIDEVMLSIDGNEEMSYVMEDYDHKETITVYEGRYPLHSNEIALGGHLAELLHKSIGDEVTLEFGDREEDYIVTGLSQGAYRIGMSSITYGGMMKLNPEFKQQQLNIYLNKGVNVETFTDKLRSIYGDSIIYTMDVDQMMEEGAGVYISIVSKVGIGILAVTLAVVILVLYFIINSSVVRRRRELGIQKAIGFTTLQLMNQLSLGFLLPMILGVCIGSYFGATQTNPIMSMAQRGMGIMRSNYIVRPLMVVFFSLGVLLLSYLISLVITYRVHRISAYALVSE